VHVFFPSQKFLPAAEAAPRGGGVVKNGPYPFPKPYIRIRNQPCPRPHVLQCCLSAGTILAFAPSRPLSPSGLRGVFGASVSSVFSVSSVSSVFRFSLFMSQLRPLRCLPPPQPLKFYALLDGSPVGIFLFNEITVIHFLVLSPLVPCPGHQNLDCAGEM